MDLLVLILVSQPPAKTGFFLTQSVYINQNEYKSIISYAFIEQINKKSFELKLKSSLGSISV